MTNRTEDLLVEELDRKLTVERRALADARRRAETARQAKATVEEFKGSDPEPRLKALLHATRTELSILRPEGGISIKSAREACVAEAQRLFSRRAA